jgi:hypothetical protein
LCWGQLKTDLLLNKFDIEEMGKPISLSFGENVNLQPPHMDM